MSASTSTSTITTSQGAGRAAGGRRLGRRSLLAIALAAVSAFGAVSVSPQETHAATLYGWSAPATVWCLSGPGYHQLRITPNAYPADSLWSQQITYHYWLYSYATRSYISIPSSGNLVMTSYANGMGMPTMTATVAPGNYSVLVQYWWPATNGTWSSVSYWTQGYFQNGYNTPRTDGYCLA